MKKVFICFLTFIILVSTFGCNQKKTTKNYPEIEEFTNATEEDLEPYMEDLKKSVESYYLSLISSKKKFPIFTMPLSKTCKKYLKSKFQYEKENDNKYGKKYIDGEYTIDDYSIVDNKLICIVSANVIFQYEDLDSNSNFVDKIQVVIENPDTPSIVDWYNGDPASFDSITRGHDLDLKKKVNLLENQNIEEIIDKGAKLQKNK